MLSLSLGHEIIAVFAVVAAFFSGLAFGSWLFDRLIGASRVPGRWYAAFELAIGVWALVLTVLVPWANLRVPTLLGTDPGSLHHWGTAFFVPFILLFPATVAMGGTLPALERLLSRLRGNGWSVGGLYATNTFGAVVGTLVVPFVVLPAIGFAASLWLLAGVNLACAIAMLAGPARREERLAPVPSPPSIRPSDRRLLVTLFATGLLGIGYEVLVIRVLSQVLANTIYTFAAILAVYLLGTAIGAALYQRFSRPAQFTSQLARLLAAVATLCLLGTAVLWFADRLHAVFAGAFGSSTAGAIAAEMGVALAVFLLPTLGMGALFSHLAQALRRPNGGLGAALAVNLAGGALAPLLLGVLLLPAVGGKAALILCAVAYLPLIPMVGRATPLWATTLWAGVPALAAAALFFLAGPLRFDQVPEGGRLITHVDGTMAAVSVIADANENRYLQVNAQLRMGGTATARSDQRQAHIPLLLHDHPHRALFLGLGTGATMAAAADYPGLAADGVELIPEILPLLGAFAPVNGSLATMPGMHLHIADARRFVRAAGPAYDVIVADLFHPWVDGAAFLYTREHFAAVRQRLASGGLFCQWLPLHQLDRDTLRLIVRSFLAVFPDASAYLATFSLDTPILALVGSATPRRFPPDYVERRVGTAALRARLQAVGLGDDFALFGLFLGAAPDLARFAGEGPLNTDDRPLVLFRAPHAAYAMTDRPAERLLALLQDLRPRPDTLIDATQSAALPDAMTEARLAAYWRARSAFIEAGLRAEPTTDVSIFAKRTAPDLLAVARISPDFEPAIGPLRTIARRLATVDPAGAETLLAELQAIVTPSLSGRKPSQP